MDVQMNQQAGLEVGNVTDLRNRREYPTITLRVDPSEVRDGDVLCYDDERWTVVDAHMHRIEDGASGWAILTEGRAPDTFVLDPRDGEVVVERRAVCEWIGVTTTVLHGVAAAECQSVATCVLQLSEVWKGGDRHSVRLLSCPDHVLSMWEGFGQP